MTKFGGAQQHVPLVVDERSMDGTSMFEWVWFIGLKHWHLCSRDNFLELAAIAEHPCRTKPVTCRRALPETLNASFRLVRDFDTVRTGAALGNRNITAESPFF